MTDDLKALRAAADAAIPGYTQRYSMECDYNKYACEDFVKPIPDGHGDWVRHNTLIALANPATIKRLLDRLEAAERDAARYRWLRYGDNDELVIQHGPVAPDYHWLPRNERLDTMIDAAMAAQQGGKDQG